MNARVRAIVVKFALGLGLWTLLGLVLALQAWLLIDANNRAALRLGAPTLNISLWELLKSALANCYFWGLLSVPVLWLGRRYPLGWRSLLVHLLGCLLFIALEIGLNLAASGLLREELPRPLDSWEVLWLYVMARFPTDLLIYWIIVCVSQALLYHRKYQERELRASQLEGQLAQAQLQVLKMQLHPHFLFNTLHAISALLHEDVEVADRMIARLGELLRATLERAGVQEVALREELDFIRPYLEIEQARMGERLTVTLAVEPEALDARVPNLLLQPLVENAIRHGVAPRAEPGHIEIRARRDGATLRLEVCDDGPGLAPTKFREGVGVANTRARLRQLYGDAHAFEMRNESGQGLTVAVTIPYREHTRNGTGLPEDHHADSRPGRG